LKPDLQIQQVLASGVFLAGGALDSVLAAGGEVDGGFAKLHCRTNALGESYPGGAVKGE